MSFQDQTLKTLKKLLKQKGFTYANVASSMNLTESGVKKMLNAKDITIGRLSGLCQLMGITLAQFTVFSEQQSIPVIRLTPAQEEFLLSTTLHLRIYWRFVVEKKDLAQMSYLEKTPQKEISSILEKLAQKNLIKKTKNDYSRLQEGKFRFDEKSSFTRYLNKMWSELTLQRTLDRSLKNEDSFLHRLLTLQLSQKAYSEFTSRIENLILEISNRSTADEFLMKSNEISPVTMLFCMAPIGVLDSKY